MIHILKPSHYAHFVNVGIKLPLGGFLSISDEEYNRHYVEWQKSFPEASKDELHMRVLAHAQTLRQQQPTVVHHRNELRVIALLLLLLLVLLFATRAHAQFSQINTITVTDGTTSLFTAAPFQVMFSGCTVSGTGSSMTVTCASGGTNTPGGSLHQIQTNGGTVFNAIANGTAGQVLCSNGSTADPSMCDPVVSGPDAPGVAPTKNPVQIGLYDGTNVQRVLGSAAGRLSVDVNSAPTTAITAAALPLPSGAAADSSLTTIDTDLKSNITLHAGTNVIGHVIADSGSTTAVTGNVAVTKADGTDVTLGAKADAKSTATDTTAVTIMQVLKEISALEQAPASRAVTNAGTFATQAAQSGTWTVQPGNTANTTAWKVDGSAVTQPVSGSVTVTQATGTNLHTVCDSGCSSSTAPADEATFTEGTTSFSPFGGYFKTSPTSLTSGQMGAVGMTATRHLFVNLPDALPAGTNVIGHIIADSGSTTAVSGTVAVTQSGTWTVQPGNTANTTAWKVDGSAVTQPISGTVTTSPPANASTNIAQVSGAATSATNPLYTRETDGTNPVVLDPCRTQANIFKPISQTASAQLVTGTSAKKIYICSINLVTAAANNVAMVEGTGTTCATGIAGMAGGTTAATGWNFAANGGLTQGNGMGSIMAEATNADNLCLLQSAAVQLSGVIGYVVQ